jgi:hypothetical protein
MPKHEGKTLEANQLSPLCAHLHCNTPIGQAMRRKCRVLPWHRAA